MPDWSDIWMFLAGIAIFLLGMNFLEEGLRNLAGRSFKLFLKKHTSNKLKAILGGAAVTAVLQSSSVVNLMVLAFTGAGIIQMQNALAVILGANLGTTLSSWIIATVGFKFNIESFSLPITALAGVLMILANKESRWYNWCRFLFGFGFLFLGLGYIRNGMEQAVSQLDLGMLEKQPAILFLLAGIIITSLVQSSSATVAIVLSALHVNAISLFAATAIVLGSEIGTTIKLVLASIKGLAVKKRVALGNILFNGINTLVIFTLLGPINRLITEIIGIHDTLLALVFFQSFVNLAGILLFYPFLEAFGRFLEKRFTGDENETVFINKVKAGDTELAVTALEKEIQHLLFHVTGFTLAAFEKKPTVAGNLKLRREFAVKTLPEKYEYIKQLHGEVHQFTLKLQQPQAAKESRIRVSQLIDASRNTMYAAKNIKDALPDIEQLRKSSNELKYDFYIRTGNNLAEYCNKVNQLLVAEHGANRFEQLVSIYQAAQLGYRKALEELYHEGAVQSLTEIEFSTVVNFNREIYTFAKSVVFALKDYVLTEEEGRYFDELPGFIR